MNTSQTVIALVVVLVVVLIYTKSTPSCPDDVKGLNEKLHRDVDVYLFWTGGFDSTFRLCQLLIDEHKVVQPIYIMDLQVDGIPGGIRKSWYKEIQTMNNIIAHLHKHHPCTKQLLKPTLFIRNTQLDRETINTMTTLHHLGFTSRPVNQWAYMAQVLTDLRITAEVGLIDEETPHFRRALENRLREVHWDEAIKPNCAGMFDNHKFVDKRHREAYWFNKLPYAQSVITNCQQPMSWRPASLARFNTVYAVDPSDKELKIFHNMRFPLYNLRKNDLFNYANKQGYGDTLRITWSCWQPNWLGRPCGKCEMCKARIV